MWHRQREGGSEIHRMMKGDLSEEVTIELNDEKLPALGSSGGFRESGLPRAKSQCKGPVVAAGWICSRNRKRDLTGS